MIKRYFIVVLLLFLFSAGVSAQRRTAAKKDWKAKYDYVGAVHDGRILVHRGGEGSNPRMGRFYTDGCFGYTDTCGTVVIPLIYDYADSFSNGFAVVGKGKRTIAVSGLSIGRGVKSYLVFMRMSPVFHRALPGYRRGRIPSAAMGMSIRWGRS